ncbi:Histone-Lysine N-Methyltransferase ash1l [Physocladia obscura]|uniref:Histone-Lysine N-Methyltransferase ash1l n=1 Tax=Physocladia obscura TaxID=109957 RepID=A0AAD5T2G6_9FUNG|nr:Histone-Lysine N-Methyltransferase ash1l [Physocladia obscura]
MSSTLEVNVLGSSNEAPGKGRRTSTSQASQASRLSRLSAASTTASALVGRLGDVRSTGGLEQPDVPGNTEQAELTNRFRESWLDFLTLRGSVINNIYLPAALFSLWGAVWTAVYLKSGWTVLFPNSQALITVISFVLALILGYRTNAAYDRYWEARKVWSTLVTHSRNLARAIWCSTNTQSNKQFETEKLGAINLILAFAVSTKHYLRDEYGHNYTDLAHLLIHIPKFRPGSGQDTEKINIPVEISLLLTEYVRNAETNKIIDATPKTVMNTCIAGMLECLSNFERIRNTPIPLAYAVHLKHILVLFLLAIPFQIPQVLGWLSIPVMVIASFTLLGIESISNEIEQPFGYDANDLRLNEFCNQLRLELNMLTHSAMDSRDVGKSMPGAPTDIATSGFKRNRELRRVSAQGADRVEQTHVESIEAEDSKTRNKRSKLLNSDKNNGITPPSVRSSARLNLQPSSPPSAIISEYSLSTPPLPALASQTSPASGPSRWFARPYLPTLNLTLFKAPLPHPVAFEKNEKIGKTRIKKNIAAFFHASSGHPPRPLVLFGTGGENENGILGVGALVGWETRGLSMEMAMRAFAIPNEPLHIVNGVGLLSASLRQSASKSVETALKSLNFASPLPDSKSKGNRRNTWTPTSSEPSSNLETTIGRGLFINEIMDSDTARLVSAVFVDELFEYDEDYDSSWSKVVNGLLQVEKGTGEALFGLFEKSKSSSIDNSSSLSIFESKAMTGAEVSNKRLSPHWVSLEKYIHEYSSACGPRGNVRKSASFVTLNRPSLTRLQQQQLNLSSRGSTKGGGSGPQPRQVQSKRPLRKVPSERNPVSERVTFGRRSNSKVNSEVKADVVTKRIYAPGERTREAEAKWDDRYPAMKELYSRKDFLSAGLYSGFLNNSATVSSIPSNDLQSRSNLAFAIPATETIDSVSEKSDDAILKQVSSPCSSSVFTPPSLNSLELSDTDLNIQQQTKPRKQFKFSMPLYHGSTILENEEDFWLPFDLFRFVECVGAGELAPVPQMNSIGARKPDPFIRIKKNIFVDRKPRKDVLPSICSCVLPADGSPACGADCLNRVMQFECMDGKCPTGAACSNRSFQTGETAPNLEICETVGRGFGIRTNEPISKNKLVMEYCGEIVSQQTCLERMDVMYAGATHYYFLNYDKSEVIDGGRKGSDARFVNHSCDPNCRIEKWAMGGEYFVGLFADKDIEAGAEITYDYKFESFGPMKKCLCGGKKCRGFLGLNKNNDGRTDIQALKLATLSTFDPSLMAKDNDSGTKYHSFSFKRSTKSFIQPVAPCLPFVIKVFSGNPFDSGINITYFGGVTPEDTLLTLYKDAASASAAEGAARPRPFLKRNLLNLWLPEFGNVTDKAADSMEKTAPVFLRRTHTRKKHAISLATGKGRVSGIFRRGRSSGGVGRWRRKVAATAAIKRSRGGDIFERLVAKAKEDTIQKGSKDDVDEEAEETKKAKKKSELWSRRSKRGIDEIFRELSGKNEETVKEVILTDAENANSGGTKGKKKQAMGPADVIIKENGRRFSQRLSRQENL